MFHFLYILTEKKFYERVDFLSSVKRRSDNEGKKGEEIIVHELSKPVFLNYNGLIFNELQSKV